MYHEFRGRSIEEVVGKVFERRESKMILLLEPCELLSREYDELVRDISRHEQDIERIKKKIVYLKQDLEKEAVMQSSSDKAIKIIQIVSMLASFIPAVRAVQIGIRAYKAASGAAAVFAAGGTLGAAVSTISIPTLLGIAILSPSTKQELDDAITELEWLKQEIGSKNERIITKVQSMHELGCLIT